MLIGTAGHIDHGKSTLVKALTGVDADRLPEEKARGITLDLGYAYAPVGGTGSGGGDEEATVLAFIDVPGHVKFLRNMLAGVGGVTACVFVVAATEGWKPQSEGHLRILELLGIEHGIVALTKVDLVDDEWLELAQMEVADHVAGTFLEQATVVPVSIVAGTGLDEMRVALDRLIATSAGAADRQRPRLWLDRVFAAKGSGTVGTGTLVGGALQGDPRRADGEVLEQPLGAWVQRHRAPDRASRPLDLVLRSVPAMTCANGGAAGGAGELAASQSSPWVATALHWNFSKYKI